MIETPRHRAHSAQRDRRIALMPMHRERDPWMRPTIATAIIFAVFFITQFAR